MALFKTHNYPEYWLQYKKHFKSKKSNNINTTRFIVFDTETTGLDIKKDRILSIGTIGINNLILNVSDNFECYVKQDLFKSETVKIHGLLKNGNNKISEEKAIIAFLNHIKDAVLVAHHAAFDVAMINQSLKRLKLPKLKNKMLDTNHLFQKTKIDESKPHFSLDDLSNKFKIPLHDRHTASGDAYITALIFVKTISALKKKNKDLPLKDLFKNNKRLGLL